MTPSSRDQRLPCEEDTPHTVSIIKNSSQGLEIVFFFMPFLHISSSAFPQKGHNYQFTEQLKLEFEAAFHPWQPESLILTQLVSRK